MRLAMNAELCQKIKNKLDPIQYTYMDVDEMLDFVEFNQGKRDNYAILG
jgi:predicted RNA-binding protein with EMAP domain